jgi:DNA repair protein RadA/Sms
VIVALASALCDEPIAVETAFLGEVALTGVVRPSQQAPRLLQEIARLGFKRCVVPVGTQPAGDMQLVPVRTVREALAVALPERKKSPGARED